MNKNFKFPIVLIVAVLFAFPIFGPFYAQTKTPTATPTKEASPSASVEREVRELKDKIATKVAELRQKNNKAIAGFITDISSKSIKVKSDNDTTFTIRVDESLTKYFQITGTAKKEIKKDDLKKNMYIIASGVISDNSIDANFVFVDEYLLVKSGKITEVNKTDFYIKVISPDRETHTIDIESYTKKSLLNIKTLVVETVGFSKIKEGDTIYFVAKKTGNEQESNRYPGTKILIVPQEFFVKPSP